MFRIYDGRSHFWQWDSGQKLVTSDIPIGTAVQFYSDAVKGKAFTVLVKQEYGARVCDVPNILLTYDSPIKVYVYVEDAKGNRTTLRKTFLVKPREKPSDYIYTETMVYTLQQALAKAVDEVRQGPPGPAGEDGKDGVSIEHSWNGTVLTIKSASGTSSVDLVGEKGATGLMGPPGPKGKDGEPGKDGKDGVQGIPGPRGADGKAPVKGVDYYTEEEKQAFSTAILEMLKSTMKAAKIGEVTLLADAWVGEDSLYSQVVEIEGVTENSQVDLTPDVQQLAVFYNKDLSFVTENEDGVVTVYAIGQKPANDYTIQVTITEVDV